MISEFKMQLLFLKKALKILVRFAETPNFIHEENSNLISIAFFLNFL